MSNDFPAFPAGAAGATSASGPDYTPNGESVAAGNAISWWGGGWTLFTRSVGLWIAIVIILFVVSVVLAVIPILGGLVLQLAYPVLIGGLMLGCRVLDRGGELEIGHLFAGTQNHLMPLVVVGALYLVAMMVVGVIVLVIMFGGIGLSGFTALMSGGDNPQLAATALSGMVGALGLGILIALACGIPLLMAVWFAPALVVFHNVEPIEAMKQSFRASMKNFVPFLIYGIIGFVLAVVASLPFMLGWLIVGPMTIASVYNSYRDIFRPRD